MGTSREETYWFLCGVCRSGNLVERRGGVSLDVAFHSPENCLLGVVGESPESPLLQLVRVMSVPRPKVFLVVHSGIWPSLTPCQVVQFC